MSLGVAASNFLMELSICPLFGLCLNMCVEGGRHWGSNIKDIWGLQSPPFALE